MLIICSYMLLASSAWAQSVQLRFVDSATGYAVKPDSVTATPQTRDAKPVKVRRNGVSKAGRTKLDLNPGQHLLTVHAAGYRSMEGEFLVAPDNPYAIVFQLDPIALPPELEADRITALHRENQTVYVGFVVDDEDGHPLQGVVVQALPSGNRAATDARGYFAIYVPVQTLETATTNPAKLVFAIPGFQTEERRYLELWSRGDWTYRIRLKPGEGINITDERELRPRTQYPIATVEAPPANGDAKQSEAAAALAPNPTFNNVVSGVTGIVGMANLAGPAPVRIPTNIRVLRSDGVTIDYISLQTYCQRSLPSEWIASWGTYGPGGSGTNCLMAGAVAIRTYAIGFINNPQNSNYDICGTTSCQAYNHTASASLTTAAVNATANYVMIQPGATRIAYKLTEYSAENNQLGQPCGDGFTAPTGGCLADPVCTGETEFGHGRGMCQWGTARWATGRRMANRTTSDGTTNGYPIQNWVWICEHYYPNLQLVQGAPLTIDDFVQIQGVAILTIRQCADGSISSGTGCPAVATNASGANGVIVGGPVRITSDGIGYTWWRVRWFDASSTVGWAPENWLERITAPLNAPPVLADMPNQSSFEEVLFSFTNSTSASSNAEVAVADFESYASGTANGTVMFRIPGFSGSTDEFLGVSPNLTTVTGTFPPGPAGARVLLASWNWIPTNNPWLRLTTSSASSLPNPVIDLNRKLRFDIYSDRPLGIGLGIRETGNPAGTAMGSNGGTSPGIIEFVGVTNVVSGQPQPTRIIPASNWMTLTFDLPAEPIRNFVGGNGVKSSATGLGVLEHLAFVPADGTGTYNVYLDNFVVSTPKQLTYSLSNAPLGATIHPTTGDFAWTPTESQGPGIYAPTIRVTDNNLPPMSDAKSVQITVAESNLPPVLTVAQNQIVHAGTLVLATNTATDPDLPANSLTYSLEPGAPVGASIGSTSGVINWQTSEAQINTTNTFTVRVADNGIPPFSDLEAFAVTVLPRPAITDANVLNGSFELTWTAIPGQSYRVQYKDDLSDPTWNNLSPDITATLATASISDPLAATQRFYRVQVITP